MMEQGILCKNSLHRAKNKLMLGKTLHRGIMLMSLESMNTRHTQKTFSNQHAYGCKPCFQEESCQPLWSRELGLHCGTTEKFHFCQDWYLPAFVSLWLEVNIEQVQCNNHKIKRIIIAYMSTLSTMANDVIMSKGEKLCSELQSTFFSLK